MQIGNGIGNTVFAYNSWVGGSTSDVGIGNAPTGNPDWTFAANASNYTLEDLSIWISDVPEPPDWSILLVGVAVLEIRRRHRPHRSSGARV
jgi:hypothetical protein